MTTFTKSISKQNRAVEELYYEFCNGTVGTSMVLKKIKKISFVNVVIFPPFTVRQWLYVSEDVHKVSFCDTLDFGLVFKFVDVTGRSQDLLVGF